MRISQKKSEKTRVAWSPTNVPGRCRRRRTGAPRLSRPGCWGARVRVRPIRRPADGRCFVRAIFNINGIWILTLSLRNNNESYFSGN